MKVNLYMDVYQGCQTAHLFATTQPCAKGENARRLMIVVNVPDEFLYGHRVLTLCFPLLKLRRWTNDLA